MKARDLIVWIVVGLGAVGVIAWSFPRAFPLFPTEWEISKAEAEAISLERLRDLGPMADDPYLVMRIYDRSSTEPRLQRLLEDLPAAELRASRLGRDYMGWEVSVYARDARSVEWSHRTRVSPQGDVTQLQVLVPPEEEGGVIEPAEAMEQAGQFLREQGIDLEAYGEPEVRTRQLQARTDTILRYPDLEGLLGDDYSYGLEVVFAGERLTGYSTFYEDQGRYELQGDIQILTLLNQVWIFITLLLLPLVAIPFVRRYHAGEIGVRRGLQLSSVVVACGVLTMLVCARAASAGWNVGVLTRPQVTGVVGVQMVVLFFFPMGLMAMLSWSVGEAICRKRWATRLAAFDALFHGDWRNSTFAAASLRGVVSGLAALAVMWAAAVLVRPWGWWSSSGHVLGPWWESASWFAIPLLAFNLAYALYSGLFGRLLLVTGLGRLLGKWAGAIVASILGGVLFFPSLIVFPVKWSLPFWILASAFWVFLVLRYGLFTSILAQLTASVASGAIPLLGAADASMQFQASLALLAVAAPLIVSIRHVTSSEKFVYRYEDIPPHVRRIADRERQKVELETARRIQTSILPQLPPELNGVSVCHAYLPATEVGGDFYDVLALEDGRLAVAVGDVAGHGVSSGLVMSMTKSALAVQVTFDPEVEAVFATLNRMVFQSARKRLLATLCYALVDPQRLEMFYASAGHLFPYRVTLEGKVQALESVSYPLGVRDELEVRVRSSRLESGDKLFLFSDGVVEARPEGSDEMFGFDRLEESLARHAKASVEQLRDAVLDDLASYTGNTPREDDLTVLVLQLP